MTTVQLTEQGSRRYPKPRARAGRARSAGARALADGAGNASKLFLIHAGVTLAIVGSLAGIRFIGCGHEEMILYGTWLMLALTVWAVWSWAHLGGKLFGPYGLLLVGCVLYHGGQFFLHLWGIPTGRFGSVMDLFRFSGDTLAFAQAVVLTSLCGLHAGALASRASYRSGAGAASFDAPDRGSESVNYWTAATGLAFIVVSIVPFALYAHELLGRSIVGGYGAVWDREVAGGVSNWKYVFARALAPGAIFLLAGSKGRRTLFIVSVAVIVLQAVTNILIGLRSESILPLLGWLYVYHSRVRPFPRALMVAGAVFLVFVVAPLVAIVRTTPLSKVSVRDVVDTYTSLDNPAVAFLEETGISTIVVADVVELVPTHRPYGFGTGYLSGLCQPVNFLMGADFTGGYGMPEEWLVEARYRERLSKRQFLGFSIIGEAYVEFGLVGAPILLALVGFLAAAAERWSVGAMAAPRVALLGVFVSFIPHLTRGSIETYGSPIFRYALVPYVVALALHAISRGRLRRRPARRGPVEGAGPQPAREAALQSV